MTLATLTSTQRPLSEALQRLRALDLSMIRMKLADPKEGKGWNPAQLDLAEGEYRKFLALCLAYPDDDIVPCTLVDETWHAHILDTQAYAQDCDTIFGFFYHHFPDFGMQGDEAELWDAYELTMHRYMEAFGDPPPDTWRRENAMKCTRTNCRPQRCR